jgi:hypothetical protein
MDEAPTDPAEAIRAALAAHLSMADMRSEMATLRAEQAQDRATLARMEATLSRLTATAEATAQAETRIADREEARTRASSARWERWATPAALVIYALLQGARKLLGGDP